MADQKKPENYIDDYLASKASKVRKLRERISVLDEERKVTVDNIKMLKSELDVALGDLDRTSIRRESGEQMMFPEATAFEDSPFS